MSNVDVKGVDAVAISTSKQMLTLKLKPGRLPEEVSLALNSAFPGRRCAMRWPA
jgi:hypothetical protein